MEHFRETKNTLSWHKEGRFEVEVVNGVITKLTFCEPGKGPEDAGSLNSTDYKFLQNIYDSLGELFAFLQEENKRLGYKYPTDPTFHEVEPEEVERKLRVLNSSDDIDNQEQAS